MAKTGYDIRNCQSLFGYAQEVHQQSGGVCQLCGAGRGPDVSFDFWRQLTVEHLIGESQGGHYGQISVALAKKFPDMSKPDVEELAWKIELQNMITACSFCNSMTSRDRHDVTMQRLIADAPESARGVMTAVQQETRRALKRKQSEVTRKLSAVRHAFKAKVLPGLRRVRREAGRLTRSHRPGST